MKPNYFRPFGLSVLAFCLSVLPLFGSAVCLETANTAPVKLSLPKQDENVKRPGFFRKIKLLKDLRKSVKGQAAGLNKSNGGTFLLILLALLLMAGLIWFANFAGVGGTVFPPLLIVVILAIVVFGVMVLRSMKRKA